MAKKHGNMIFAKQNQMNQMNWINVWFGGLLGKQCHIEAPSCKMIQSSRVPCYGLFYNVSNSGNQCGYAHPPHHLCLRYCRNSIKMPYEEDVETCFKSEHDDDGHGHNPDTIVISHNTNPWNRTHKNPPNKSKVQDSHTT